MDKIFRLAIGNRHTLATTYDFVIGQYSDMAELLDSIAEDKYGYCFIYDLGLASEWDGTVDGAKFLEYIA